MSTFISPLQYPNTSICVKHLHSTTQHNYSAPQYQAHSAFSLLCSTLYHFTKKSVSQYHCCLSIPFPQLLYISLSVPVSLFHCISLSLPVATVTLLKQSCSTTDSSVLYCVFQSLSTSVTPPQYQSFSSLPCSTSSTSDAALCRAFSGRPAAPGAA